MRIWGRWGLNQKIGFSLGIVMFLLTGVAGVAWLNLVAINGAATIVENKIEATFEAENLKEELLSSETLITNYILTESDGDLIATRKGMDRLKSRLDELSIKETARDERYAEITKSYRSYEVASSALIASVGNRRSSSESFTQAATTITTTTAAVVATLFRENRVDSLPAGLKLNELVNGGIVAVSRYLATRNPAYADTAKQRVDSLNEAIEALKTGTTNSNRIQKFLKLLTPQISDYTSAIDALITATDQSNRTVIERKAAAGHLLALTLQLRFLGFSESMGDHDSGRSWDGGIAGRDV
ncbi:hypothetical protein CCP2SC5_600014 [Azospirillaceae bacterium]